jgi:6-phosphogluconolactonase
VIVRRFAQMAAMEQQATELLREHFELASAAAHAVMLTGGRTPLGVYRQLADWPARADERLHVLVSDERHVPLSSPQNNFAKLQPMIAAMGLDDSQVMRVHTELTLQAAADRYHQELASFLAGGGKITLGILGLGADGHVASLFSTDDVARGEGRYAIAVPRPAGADRVSVTRELILKAARLVFLVAGPEKAEVVKRMAGDPHGVVAGQIVQGAAGVELWFCLGV